MTTKYLQLYTLVFLWTIAIGCERVCGDEHPEWGTGISPVTSVEAGIDATTNDTIDTGVEASTDTNLDSPIENGVEVVIYEDATPDGNNGTGLEVGIDVNDNSSRLRFGIEPQEPDRIPTNYGEMIWSFSEIMVEIVDDNNSVIDTARNVVTMSLKRKNEKGEFGDQVTFTKSTDEGKASFTNVIYKEKNDIDAGTIDAFIFNVSSEGLEGIENYELDLE